jgi:hypothetical protein
MMLGLLATSILSGQVVTRTGHYKAFPIVGSALVIVGMYLLSRLTIDTSHLVMVGDILVLGAGIGMTMQIMILATQNAVPPHQIGTGTAAVNFFRSMGGAFGTSLFGAVFIAGLSHWIPKLVPGDAAGSIHVHGSFSMSSAQLHAFPPDVQHGILESFVHSLHSVFLLGVPLATVMLALTVMLKQVKLRTSSGLERPSEDIAMGGGVSGTGDAREDEIARGVEVTSA